MERACINAALTIKGVLQDRASRTRAIAKEGVMGDVVAFRPQAARRMQARAETNAQRGEILLFMGVRYERHDRIEDKRAAGRSPRKRRNRA
jgi:hypothetical protein